MHESPVKMRAPYRGPRETPADRTHGRRKVRRESDVMLRRVMRDLTYADVATDESED